MIIQPNNNIYACIIPVNNQYRMCTVICIISDPAATSIIYI